MTETTQTDASTAASTTGAKKRGGGLGSMLLADLKSMAGGLGIAGAGSMKKAQLVEAIKAAQGASAPVKTTAPTDATSQPASSETASKAAATTRTPPPRRPARTARTATAGSDASTASTANSDSGDSSATSTTPSSETPVKNAPQVTVRQRTRGRAVTSQAATKVTADDGRPQPQQDTSEQPEKQQPEKQPKRQQNEKQRSKQSDAPAETQRSDSPRSESEHSTEKRSERHQGGKQDENQQGHSRGQRQQEQAAQPAQQGNPQGGSQQSPDLDHDDDGEGGSRRNRRRRGRDRDRQGMRPSAGRGEPDTTVLEDDVLVPAAGILDVLDNYAFVRTSGYLPGTDDVYLSLSMVRKFGLRRGDAVVGQVRQPREGERKEKFNPMVRIDSINSTDPEAARERVDFDQLTPVHPTDRLRLETDPANLIGRVIDIAAPLGKGQRGLVVAPPKAGRTTILQSVASSISTNNPECHLMVVLLDARPEEVTDFQRAVKGEVIASTFDRSATDHTMLAELAVERAKRLVELGHDVVVLLDSLTSLGRAYNVALPASGRTLAGGVDAAAVLPPKQFFGAARNVEGGGSLTILATALHETGSATNEVFLEELGGTANMELRLRRELAEAATFPAIDIVASGTRQEAVLTSAQEAEITGTLRQQMSAEPLAAVVLAVLACVHQTRLR